LKFHIFSIENDSHFQYRLCGDLDMSSFRIHILIISFAFFSSSALLHAQELPYFLTYSHHMEEPGSLEVSASLVSGQSKGINPFLGSATELEYGTKGWWTTELYLDGQSTRHDSTLFTGFRLENRFRLLMREHRINPVLYVEYESINGADKTLKEVVGFDSKDDQSGANADARREHKREVETKLILSSDFKGWNLSENFIAEKNLQQGTWEFGYAIGLGRPLALAATASPCNLCRENFTVGAEAYGGLGTWNQLSLVGTSHYIAPVLAWNLPSGTTLRVSAGLGLMGNSHDTLLRFGVSHEIPRFDRQVKGWLHGRN
jgi:hypothetical protein